MEPPTPGMLAERQLRAAEIALEAARQRRREADAQLAALESALAASQAAREQDRVALEEQLALARVGETAAEQRYVAERRRRLSVEQQLAVLARARTRRDELTRQLDAEARIVRLEGELELVTRRAAAFEYGVRMAVFDAFKLVRDMTDHVTALLARTGLIEAPAGEAATVPAPVGQAPSVASVLDAQRLDAALERLRATTPPPADES